jgi:Peptidase family M1 domain
MPPKFPQPRTMREIAAVVPSTAGFYERVGQDDPVFTCPPPSPSQLPPRDRPRYELNVQVSPGFARVHGDLTVRFAPNRGTDRVVFRLWPNGPRQLAEGQSLLVGGVKIDGKAVGSRETDPTTLVISYGIAAHQTVRVHMTWRLRVPPGTRDRISRSHGVLRLGSFFPLLAWDERRGWVTDPPTLLLAETSTSPTADFDLRVVVPRNTQAVASGTEIAKNRWHASAVRDIAVAVGRFRSLTRVVRVPQPVTVHVAASGTSTQPRSIMRWAIEALRHYSRTYGAYRWHTFTLVAQSDLFNEGIEYPTLVFVGYGPIEKYVVHHETAHQWFYSLVGNDQAQDPWLDEALATWSQARLDATTDFQRLRRMPHHVGAPMTFWAGKGRRYYREVYSGGLTALLSLGSPQKVDCALKLYVARDAYRIAQPGDLLDALNRVIPGAERRLRGFGIHR